MAILQLGPLVTGIRGKLAGVVFSANGSGPYVKGWGRSSNPRSILQTTERGYISSQATRWQNLAPIFRAAWNIYAAQPAQELTNPLGETYFASGFNWFVRINQHLLQVGLPERTQIPTIATPAAPTLTSITIDTVGATSNIVYPAGTFGANEDLFYEMGMSIGHGRDLVSTHPYIISDTTPPGTTLNIHAETLAVFGAIQTNRKWFGRLYRQTNQGRRSSPGTNFTTS